ncbi:MAG: hypothetical protein QM780_16640 [Hyphomicrobium sp.]|uniref:hypothetical protein n=1 Tax=Hyphomicrobium sp. TaxID=82 RepID=UPI0039E2B4A3
MQDQSDDDATADHKSVVLGFAGMLLSGGSADDVARFATDHGWLDATGQLTAAGEQLADALAQQGGTRTVFRV